MNETQYVTTKEKIINVSIDLFAEKGFKDVSVREIAAAVGIKASSLYKHYANKEEILESIFLLFKEKVGQANFPEEEIRQYIQAVTPETYLNESFNQFKKIMWSPLAIKIAKIITKEQQRNHSVKAFFIQEIIEKPTQTMQSVFDMMIANGSIPVTNTQILAEEYCSYIICLFFEQNLLQEGPNLKEIDTKMKQHNQFYACNILKMKEGN